MTQRIILLLIDILSKERFTVYSEEEAQEIKTLLEGKISATIYPWIKVPEGQEYTVKPTSTDREYIASLIRDELGPEKARKLIWEICDKEYINRKSSQRDARESLGLCPVLGRSKNIPYIPGYKSYTR